LAKFNKKIIIFFLFTFYLSNLFFDTPLFAANERLIIANMESLYNARRFNELEQYAKSLLEKPELLYPEELAAVHSYLGFTYVILRREQEAKENFIEWLKLEPNAFLDPILVPPNIIRIFELAKDALKKERGKITLDTSKGDQWPYMKSVLWRSLVYPGWGQYYNGKRYKGALIMGTETALLAGFAISQINYIHARDAYYSETQISRMDEKYDAYNNWNCGRWGFAAASLILYIGAQYDVFRQGINIESQKTTFSLEPTSLSRPDSQTPICVGIRMSITR
jgi:hypothetical protein